MKKRDVRFLEDDNVLIRKGKGTDYTEDSYNAPLLKDEDRDREPATESPNEDSDRESATEPQDEDPNCEDAQTEIECEPLSSRGGGRPATMKTARPGRPMKKYQTANPNVHHKDPNSVKEAMDSPEKHL